MRFFWFGPTTQVKPVPFLMRYGFCIIIGISDEDLGKAHMEHYDFNKIEIKEGYMSGADTNISPARRDPSDPEKYTQDFDHMISVGWLYLWGYLGVLLNKYYCTDIQMPYYEDITPHEYYDDYGWNFFTPGQIRCLLADLQEFVDAVSADPFDSRYEKYLKPNDAAKPDEQQRMDYIRQHATQLTDFYSRFIARMMIMLDNMGDYDLVMFVGP